MSSAFHSPKNLANGSYVLLTNQKPDTAVVFVHGYGGNPTGTWCRFQSLIDEMQKRFQQWATYDAYFYRYDSVGLQVLINAKDLLGFVNNVFPTPQWKVLDSRSGGGQWRPTRHYTNLILAAHSEGAVIVRRAVLEQIRLHRDRYWSDQAALLPALKRDPILSAYLRLFAPAGFGAQLSGWKGLLLNLPGLRALMLPLMQRSAAYQNIAHGSTILKEIQRETTELVRQYREIRALRARTLFGRRDDVVAADVSFYDESPEIEDSANHVSVCKPTASYTRPLEFVAHDKSETANP
jgi:hypothetical protein